MSIAPTDTISIPRGFIRDRHLAGWSVEATSVALAFWYLESTPQNTYSLDLLEHLTNAHPGFINRGLSELECLNVISTETGGPFSDRTFTFNPVDQWIVQGDDCACIGG